MAKEATPSELAEYRKHLVTVDERAQENYDKTVLSLSGGALGISFAFLDSVVGNRPIRSPFLLGCAWLSWAISLAIVLLSFSLSHFALLHAIKQVDAGSIYRLRPGGWYAIATSTCNVLSGMLFLAGLILMGFFVFDNLR